MKCSVCGALNPSDSKTCVVCGNPIPLINLDDIVNELTSINSQDDNVSSEKIENTEEKRSYFTTNSEPTDALAVNNATSDDKTVSNEVNHDEQNTYNNGDDGHVPPVNNDSKRKSKVPVIIGIVIGVIVIIGVLIGTFLMLNKAPDRIYKASINKLFSAMEKSLDEEHDTYKGDFNMGIKIISDDEQTKEEAEILNNFNIGLSLGVDNKNAKFDYNVNVKYENKDFLNIDAVYDKKAYLIFNNILDKPIEIACDDCESLFKKQTNKDVKVVLNAFGKALQESLNKKYFSKEKKDVIVDGKSIKATANIMKLDAKAQAELNNSVIDKLLDDNEFIKSTAVLTETKESMIKEKLNNAKLEVESATGDEVEITLFTTGFENKPVKVSFNSKYYSLSIISKNEKNVEFTMESSGIAIVIDTNFKMSYDEKISLPDTSNAVSEKQMGEEDLQKALNNLMEQAGFKAFDEDFKSLTGFGVEEYMTRFFYGKAMQKALLY